MKSLLSGRNLHKEWDVTPMSVVAMQHNFHRRWGLSESLYLLSLYETNMSNRKLQFSKTPHSSCYSCYGKSCFPACQGWQCPVWSTQNSISTPKLCPSLLKKHLSPLVTDCFHCLKSLPSVVVFFQWACCRKILSFNRVFNLPQFFSLLDFGYSYDILACFQSRYCLQTTWLPQGFLQIFKCLNVFPKYLYFIYILFFLPIFLPNNIEFRYHWMSYLWICGTI